MKRLGLLALLICSPCYAQSITVPAMVTVPTPGLVIVRATAMDADSVTWIVLTPGLQTFPPDVVTPKPGVFLGLALAQGSYQVAVVCAKDVGGKAAISDAQTITITVGTPGPGPGPTDPLTRSLQAAYSTDTDADKAASLNFLVAAYRQMSGQVPNTLKTTADALTWIRTVIENPKTGLTASQVVATRKAIAAELIATFGTDPTAVIDPAVLATELSKIEAALVAVANTRGK